MLKILDRIPLFQLRKVRPAEPSPEDVRQAWRVTCAKYGTVVVDKATAEDQKLIAKILDAMGIVPDDAFMTRFVTTLGSRIYVPFTPGTATPIWSLRAQVDVLGHEHEHVWQDRGAGGVEYAFRYATNSTMRAYYEMQAYRVDMAIEWQLWRNELDPSAVASVLRNYDCDEADIVMVTKMLRLSMVSIRKGAVPSEVARFVIDWMIARWS